MRVTLSLHELPELKDNGATYVDLPSIINQRASDPQHT